MQADCVNLNVWSYQSTMEDWCENENMGFGNNGGGGGGGGGGKGRKKRAVNSYKARNTSKSHYSGVGKGVFDWNTSKRARRGIVMECNGEVNGCDNIPANAQIELEIVEIRIL